MAITTRDIDDYLNSHPELSDKRKEAFQNARAIAQQRGGEIGNLMVRNILGDCTDDFLRFSFGKWPNPVE